MIKQCLQCNSDFEENTHTGQEQKYCSATCRYRAANSRRENKIKQEAINSMNNENTKDQYSNPTNSITSNGSTSETLQHTTNRNNHNTLPEGQNRIDNANHHYQPQTSIGNNNGFGYSSDYIGLLGKYYETQGEARFMYSELTKANDRIRELEDSLEEYYEEDDKIKELEDSQKAAPMHEKIIESIMVQFKQDPKGTAEMVKTLVPALIGGVADMFKSKTA